MAGVTAIVFWIAAGVIVYTYIGYPALIYVLSRSRSVVASTPPKNWPDVSVIVCVYNEEKNVAGKISSLLALDYPTDKLQIVISSDGSTDATVKTAQQFDRVDVVHYEQQQGKPTALNNAVEQARGEILVFTDARQELGVNAIRHLVSNLQRPDVGVVSGLLVQDRNSDSPEHTVGGLYWRYEKAIRLAESRFDSVPGATGALYAIRRRDFEPLPKTTILDDVELPMGIVRKGLRCILDDRALAHDVVADHDSEIARKIRTLTGNFQLIARHPWLLSPIQNPLFFQFFSHKILRLFVPYMLVIVAVAPFFLEGAYRSLIPLQAAFYSLALVGFTSVRLRSSFRTIGFAYMFLALNVAAIRALVRFLSTRYTVRWKNA